MMKKFLKSLSLVMALVMCFTMVFTAAVSADGANPAITFGVKDSVEPGAVSIPVVLTNFADVAGVQGEITVGGLTDAAVVAGEYTNLAVSIDNGIVSFAIEGNPNEDETKLTIADGTLFTITGTAVEGTNITLAWTADETKACDTAEVLLALSYANKEITVAAAVVEPEEPAVDTKITITPYAYIGTDLGIMFQLTASELSGYATYELVLNRQIYNNSYNVEDATTTTIAKADMANAGKSKPYFIYSGIAMYELGLTVSAQVYCYDAEGNLTHVSNKWSKAMSDFLKEDCVSATNTNPLRKTMFADMLNMGAAVQKYFGGLSQNAGSDIASATLVNLDDATIGYYGANYASATVGELNAVDTTSNITWAANSPLASSTHSFMNSVMFGKSVAVAYLLKDSNKVIDLSKLSLTVKYDSLYPAGEVTETISGDKWSRQGNWINFNFEKAYLYDTNKVVSATLTYDGQEVMSGTYTVDTYCAASMSSADANTALLAETTAKFGIASRAYFAAQAGYTV